MDWIALFTAVGSVSTAGLVGVGILALRSQAGQAKTASRIENARRLVEYWDSVPMWEARARAAREIARHNPANDMADVLNFFDHLGYLLRKEWIDVESAWVMFSDWAIPYWRAANYAIVRDRRDEQDPFLWEEVEYLNRRLLKFEARRRRDRGQAYAGPTDDQVRTLLRGEIGMCPGSLRWRRWWP